MLFSEHVVVVRGGGDLGTGVAFRLNRAGFPVVVLEIAEPLAIRRAVAAASAVAGGRVEIEGLEARRVETPQAARRVARSGVIAVLVSPELPTALSKFGVVDARLAKRNIDTRTDQAACVVGLGPGFTAGVDCHAVIETMRGHHLGRVIWQGSAAPNTGEPGVVGGASTQRVIRAPADGTVRWAVAIGDLVTAGQSLGRSGETEMTAPIDGVVRGLIAPGITVAKGTKVADIDPRADQAACFEISDKALAVGGGAVEAILTGLSRVS
ncbi:MAG: EF2563 family selenium-dependent molybdenum hydroxylase system protein [Acidimicrobiia bacterium]|nr:EF2563 family selenium-dependent molybdenum hydroxylase system protein [Acidimicrobiia bacterium]